MVPSLSHLQGTSLRARVESSRAAAFAGREEELRLFEALLGPEPPFRVLLLHGPGGVGKTTLLEAFSRRARERAVPSVAVRAPDLPNGPERAQQALRARIASLRAGGGVLLLDEFEALAAWEGVFRDRFLAELPEGLRTVLAGRWVPGEPWRTDSGWRQVTRIRELADFTREETRAYLQQQENGLARAAEVHAFTRGHPLAVALTANLLAREPGARLEWEHQPELVHWLVARHLRESEPHKLALLHAAALPAHLDRPLLEAMVASSNPEAELDWLRRCPFTRERTHGLAFHELVGEAIRVEMKRREPERHAAFLRRAAKVLTERMTHASSEAAIREFVYLLRDQPVVRQHLPTPPETGLFISAYRPSDRPILADLVESARGEVHREWFDFWAARQPEGLAVLRDPDHAPVGLSFYIDPYGAGAATGYRDPAVAAFRHHLAQHAPLRSGERAHLCRFLLTAGGRHTTPLCFHNAFYPFHTPCLAFTGVVLPEADHPLPLYALSNLLPLEGTAFRLEGANYLLVGHDWRLEPPAQWAANVSERLLAGEPLPGTAPSPAEGLTRPAFGEAVKAALKGLGTPGGFADNPLLECPLVRQAHAHSGEATPEQTLVAQLTAALEQLEASAEGAELGRVLRASYWRRPPKQRVAAENLGLSYGTYRRRLQTATVRLADRLWAWDRQAAARASGWPST